MLAPVVVEVGCDEVAGDTAQHGGMDTTKLGHREHGGALHLDVQQAELGVALDPGGRLGIESVVAGAQADVQLVAILLPTGPGRLDQGVNQEVVGDFGNEAIYAGSYGWASAGRFHHAPTQLHRFMNAIGGYTRSVNTYSLAAAEVILPHVLGMGWWRFQKSHTSWDVIAGDTELVVAFGGIPLKNSQIDLDGVGRHELRGWMRRWAERGTCFVNISPIADDLGDSLQPVWMPIRPGTDTALIHTLITDGSYDRTFVDRYCTGWDSLASYVTGSEDGVTKDAEWASAITTISPARIRSPAGSLVERRSMINISWSLQRSHHGEHVVWAAIALAAAVGQIGLPGGGVGIGYGAMATVGNGSDNAWLPFLNRGRRPVDSFIPVARIADMLLRPGSEFTYNGGTYTYPDIRLVYWAGGNPFHHHQDFNRLRRA